jgi:2-amino-4-hydroxy-6-hydroxymethyldihydropteridine diphosphokinase
MRQAETRAYIGLGSNLQEPLQQVRQAFRSLAMLPGCRFVGRSRTYISDPVGPADQPCFVNAAAALDTRLGPDDLLVALQGIEQRQGRVRGERWGPRTLDLDLLLYGDRVIDSPHLQVPHPQLHRRAFVLVPLCDLAPTLEIPGRERADVLLARLDATGVSLLETAYDER